MIWHNLKLFTCTLKIEPPLPHPLRPCSFPCLLLICRPGPENHRDVWEKENSPDQATMTCRAAPRCVCRARGPADSGPDHCCSCPNTGGGSERIQRCRTVDGRRNRQHTHKLPQQDAQLPLSTPKQPRPLARYYSPIPRSRHLKTFWFVNSWKHGLLNVLWNERNGGRVQRVGK